MGHEMEQRGDAPEVGMDARESSAPVPNPRRRRLLHGSLGAAPLLMTLASRPALGNNNQCFSPSGFVSMPTSQHGQPQYCSGRTPGYWRQPQWYSQWPHPYYPVKTGNNNATLFKAAVFPQPFGPYPTQTMLEVVNMGGGPPHSVGRHVVAAILNAAKGWTPVLTVDAVKAIWGQYINTGGGTVGYYEPTAGVKWYHDQIVDYLTSTMPL